MNKQQRPLEFLSNNFAVLIAAIVAIGIIQINSYYKDNYNFDVVPYLSASEILTLSFISIGDFSLIDFLNYTSIHLILLFITYTLIRILLKRKIVEFKSNWVFIILRPAFIYFFLAVAFICKTNNTRTINTLEIFDVVDSFIDPRTQASSIMAFFFIFTAVVSLLFKANFIEHYTIKKTSTLGILFIGLIFFFFSISIYEREAKRIKEDFIYCGTVIKTADKLYLSDSCSSYIGRTTSSVFIYDFEALNMTVIPSSEVKFIQIVSTRRDK